MNTECQTNSLSVASRDKRGGLHGEGDGKAK